MDDDRWEFISGLLSDMQIQRDRLDAATEGLMIAPESPLLDVQARTEEHLLDALERIAGDSFNTISWYVYECDHGRKALEAGVNGDMREIDTLEKLRWLMELNAD